MNVNLIVLNGNPFFESYSQSDLLGKGIFLALYALSICSWSLLIYKVWVTHQAKKQSLRFYEAFQLHKSNPLNLECEHLRKQQTYNPFLDLYRVLKKQCVDVLAKNRHSSSLSLSDIDFVASHLSTQVAYQVKQLEKNLYLLSTTVSLAPFLGLLGTVWGILATFSQLHMQSGGGNQMVLGGLSMALATTVLGLVDAIPALIGYNYLKNSVRDFTTEMEGFSNEILAAVELQYRKVDVL